jgi:phosphoserine phosphatase
MLSLRTARAFTTAATRTRRNFLFSASRTMSTASIDDDSMPSFDTRGHIGNAVEQAMLSLYKADAVCFDVDSTVISEEGIDVLAEYLGKGEAVAALTMQAMEGGMPFQDALQARLELLQPSRQSILQCLQEQPLVLTDGVQGLMQALQEKKVDIWLVSGGFRIMIEPVAHQLDIPVENIVANTLLFDDDGTFQSFDATEPTSADMGKPKALTSIQAQKGYETMVMVGDGATDAQAKPPAQAFIGFGGVVERAAVKAKADWFVTDFTEMTKIVEQRSTGSSRKG